MTHVRIRLLWHPQAQFAGYLLAEYRGLAERYGILLECQPIDFEQGPIDALLSGACEFAVASPAHQLEHARSHELSLIAVIQQTSSLIYPARRADGITSPSDLARKRVAVWRGHEDLELRWLLQRYGLSANASVEFVPVGDTVRALLAGDVSCAQMTTYHELHELEARARSLDDYVLFRAGDVGASLIKDGLIARRDYIAENPVVTQHIVDSVLAGWTQAFRDPASAVAICSEARGDMSSAEHARQLNDIRNLSLSGATLSHGLGYPHPQHMLDARDALLEVEGRHAGGDVCELVDERFWSSAPAEVRSTGW